MTKKLTISSLYTKLSQIGLNRDYVRNNGLPSWWDDELNDKPSAVLEGASYIADRLNLDLKSLLLPAEKIKFNSPPPTKFKQHDSQNKDYPHVAQALASRVSELIVYGTEVNFTPLPTDVKEIRTEILTNYPTVNLTSLLEYCWSQGIIVAYFDHFPQKIKKIEGLIQWQFSRPVIIISSPYKDAEKLTFYLAHELGHLVLQHLKEGVLIDEKIDFIAQDNEENEANQFANNLLLDDSNIDPLANGQRMINQYLADRLDWDKFNDESYEYLEKVLGV